MVRDLGKPANADSLYPCVLKIEADCMKASAIAWTLS